VFTVEVNKTRLEQKVAEAYQKELIDASRDEKENP
jgi:hypothetical protein